MPRQNPINLSPQKFLNCLEFASRSVPKSVPSSCFPKESFIFQNCLNSMTHFCWSHTFIILKTCMNLTALNANTLESFCLWLFQSSSKNSLVQHQFLTRMQIWNSCTQFAWFWRDLTSAIRSTLIIWDWKKMSCQKRWSQSNRFHNFLYFQNWQLY